MRRVTLFLLLLIASLIAITTLTAIGFTIFQNQQTQTSPHGWMGQMWGGMMGQNNNTQTATNQFLPYFGATFAILIAVAIIGIIGISYYLLYPQIKAHPDENKNQNLANNGTAYESVAKTLTDEERKIIAVLNAHNGKYLQKYVRNEAGLSRLKTHRIIARLSERGIVRVEKTGNTNQVYLANWLHQQNNPK